jgi:hypothetical protein
MSSRRSRPVDRLGTEVLDADECLDLLGVSDVGRLAVVVGNLPEIFPVNFIVDHGTILFRTAPGTKLAAICDGAVVAFEIDGHDVREGVAWSVVAKGTATEVRDVHERFVAADLPLFPWHADPKPRYVRISPDEISGRRFHVIEHGEPRPRHRAAYE